MDIAKQLGRKGVNAAKIARYVIKKPEGIKELIEGLKAPKGSLRFGYEKVLRLVSEQRPDLVYPYFDVYTELLESDNSFLKWGAILTIANLAEVDTEKKFEKIFTKYYRPITGPVMVTAANIIGGSVKVALAKPKLITKITNEVLKVEKAKYYSHGSVSPECRNIALGQAIDYFDKIFDRIENKDTIVKFVKRRLKNSRKSVAKKAENFIKRHKI